MSVVFKCQACDKFPPETPGNSYSVGGLHPMAPSSPALPALPISIDAPSAPRVFLLAGKAEHPGILSRSSAERPQYHRGFSSQDDVRRTHKE